ncbi:nitrophenyl compound nitroreductase subunit ArsF family protein [Dysgonomonas capnocytophagoides]|uniref:nitrophenyl compound nitroreductase subunit ArsF family protein n=1 Tax=Dysgonomonas capnocytophagoides TaxID=45254 RepID=UPI00041C5BF1|nr:nitrophenyl compound nitroreductase subunit ArsF family protein [Dysgonomonas capnocytophagoides]
MKKSILIALFTVFLVSCGNKNTESKQAAEIDTKEQAVSMADASIVNVYYFHGKQRCKTCIAIENVTKNAVADSYKDNPNVRYVEVNIDEDQNKDLIEKYEIAFSSLLIVKADNTTDLTEQAFANAVNSPDVLTSLIKDEVNKRID